MDTGCLYENLCRKGTLLSAWLKVKKKGSSGGIDGVSVENFEKNLEKNIQQITNLLISNRYIPEPYVEVQVNKSIVTNEKRTLSLPTVTDKIVQTAVVDMIMPFFENIFLNCSYAYRKRKGAKRAIGRVNDYLQRGKCWVTTCDIDNFFDTLDHSILFSQTEEQLKDKRLLNLITLWIKMGRYDHKKGWKNATCGIAQGGVISPLLSNIYLNPFDRFMTDKDYGFVRYADDFIILSDTRDKAKRALDDAIFFLKERLRLRLNPEKIIKPVDRGFTFLGIYIKGKQKLISQEKQRKIKAKLRQTLSVDNNKSLSEIITELNEESDGWRRYYAKICAPKELEMIDKYIEKCLKKVLRVKYYSKEIKSQKKAIDILQSLQFVSSEFSCNHTKVIRNIVKNTCSRKAISSTEKRAEDTLKQNSQSVIEIQKDITYQNQEKTAQKLVAKKRRLYEKKHSKAHDIVVSKRGIFIGKTLRNIVLRKGRKTIKKISPLNLRNISITTKGVSISSDLIAYCAELKIPIDFLTYTGKPYAKLYSPLSLISTVGLAQLKALESNKGEKLAKSFVRGKIKNQINLLKYYRKYRKGVDKKYVESCNSAIKKMEEILEEVYKLKAGIDYDLFRNRLFSIEGRASSQYWTAIKTLLYDDVVFEGRERKGAKDLVNSLLNYGYGILYSRVWSAIAITGLDTHISFLHKPQPNKPTLVFDLIEEFRQQIVDRTIFAMITKGEKLEMENNLLSSETRRKLVENVLEKLYTKVHFRGQRRSMNDIIKYQARELARFLKHDVKKYKPFIGKW